MLDDLDRDREIRQDAFYGEGLSFGTAALIVIGLAALGALLDKWENRYAEPRPAPVAVQVPAYKPEPAKLTHPICGMERRQWIVQYAGPTPAKVDCLNADATARRYP